MKHYLKKDNRKGNSIFFQGIQVENLIVRIKNVKKLVRLIDFPKKKSFSRFLFLFYL